MSEWIERDDEFFEDEVRDMPSRQHSQTQTNLTVLFGNNEKFTTFVELSLDATTIDLSQFGLKNKDEMIPDISVYLEPLPEQDEGLGYDEVRVSKMPDLAVEVLSPTQSVNDLLKKMKAYFAFGVKSFWLVMPSLEVIRVFSQVQKYRDFNLNDTEVIDEVMDVHLPIAKVFGKRSK